MKKELPNIKVFMRSIMDQKYYSAFDPKVPDEFYEKLPIAILMKGRNAFSYRMSMHNNNRYFNEGTIKVGKSYRYTTIKMVLPQASDVIKDDTVVFIKRDLAILVIGEEFSANFRKFI